MNTQEVWYRYDYWTSSDGGVTIQLHKYPVLKTTPRGVRLDIWEGCMQKGAKGKFVLLKATKRYACPTVEEAKASFIARKTKQLRLLKNQIRNIEFALKCMAEAKDSWPVEPESIELISWDGK